MEPVLRAISKPGSGLSLVRSVHQQNHALEIGPNWKQLVQAAAVTPCPATARRNARTIWSLFSLPAAANLQSLATYDFQLDCDNRKSPLLWLQKKILNTNSRPESDPPHWPLAGPRHQKHTAITVRRLICRLLHSSTP